MLSLNLITLHSRLHYDRECLWGQTRSILSYRQNPVSVTPSTSLQNLLAIHRCLLLGHPLSWIMMLFPFPLIPLAIIILFEMSTEKTQCFDYSLLMPSFQGTGLLALASRFFSVDSYKTCSTQCEPMHHLPCPTCYSTAWHTRFRINNYSFKPFRTISGMKYDSGTLD